jgi:hypothetical protein
MYDKFKQTNDSKDVIPYARQSFKFTLRIKWFN